MIAGNVKILLDSQAGSMMNECNDFGDTCHFI